MKANTTTNLNRWEPFGSAPTLHEHLNRMFDEGFHRLEESNLTTWTPAVDILETEQELVVKADLPISIQKNSTFAWKTIS